MLTIPNIICIIVEAVYSFFLETINGGSTVWLKFREEGNIGFLCVVHGNAFVILHIQLLRPLRNSSVRNNVVQSWQVNSMDAAQLIIAFSQLCRELTEEFFLTYCLKQSLSIYQNLYFRSKLFNISSLSLENPKGFCLIVFGSSTIGKCSRTSYI